VIHVTVFLYTTVITSSALALGGGLSIGALGEERWHAFWKVSVLGLLLCANTVERAFQNVGEERWHAFWKVSVLGLSLCTNTIMSAFQNVPGRVDG